MMELKAKVLENMINRRIRRVSSGEWVRWSAAIHEENGVQVHVTVTSDPKDMEVDLDTEYVEVDEPCAISKVQP
jgi:hypothetical protein